LIQTAVKYWIAHSPDQFIGLIECQSIPGFCRLLVVASCMPKADHIVHAILFFEASFIAIRG